MPGDAARRALAGTRFGDIRWVEETGSTNADLLQAARGGAPEGLVLVADHQTAGRGRQGRTWTAPPASTLLTSVLLRPPAESAGRCTMAMAVAAAEAAAEVTGVQLVIKWPNDLIAREPAGEVTRKVAGILAESDWTGDEPAVVVGIGLNVSWPGELPAEIRDTAGVLDRMAGAPVGREELLIALLRRLDHWYGHPAVIEEWRRRNGTLGRAVSVDLGARHVEGRAVEVTADGHLVVEVDGGNRETFAAGDVVHLRET